MGEGVACRCLWGLKAALGGVSPPIQLCARTSPLLGSEEEWGQR